ncbi:MAG: hypothetical protein Q8K82_06940 [Gemmatimonadaceae bacterium]|nr:hypothetical protein [Gemmatimonadaceae bacterium]
MLDFGNQRLTAISEDGVPGDRVSYAMGADPRGVCELRRSRIHLRAATDREIERVEQNPVRTTESALPWPEVVGQPSLARQSIIFSHPVGDVCLVTLSFGPKFALLDDTGTRATGAWIEEIPLAQAQSTGKGSWRLAPGSVLSTMSATGVGGAFAVLFEGTSALKLRLLDFYSATDGRYLFSVELPFKGRYITYGHGLLVIAGENEDGAPFLRALRTLPSLEAMVERALKKPR